SKYSCSRSGFHGDHMGAECITSQAGGQSRYGGFAESGRQQQCGGTRRKRKGAELSTSEHGRNGCEARQNACLTETNASQEFGDCLEGPRGKGKSGNVGADGRRFG